MTTTIHEFMKINVLSATSSSHHDPRPVFHSPSELPDLFNLQHLFLLALKLYKEVNSEPIWFLYF